MSCSVFLRRAALATCLCGAAAVSADPYRITAGDELALSLAGTDEARVMIVDLDGQVRIGGIGGVALRDLTLDDAEGAIAARLVAAGLYTEPQVSLTIAAYAPVTVAGEVQQPGRFTYHPGLTVAAALALAGGPRGEGLSATDLARTRAEAEAGLGITALEIASQMARIARFEAQLSGGDVVLSAQRLDRLPDARGIQALIAAEAQVLATRRQQADQLLSFWATEIAAITAQRQTFDDRLAVQDQILTSAEEALRTARDLAGRGLQTTTRLASAEEREAEARSRMLELEAARITAARAISEAERARAQFLANQREEALTGLRAAQLDLDTAELRHRRHVRVLALLGGDLTPGLAGLRFDLQSPRADRPQGRAVTAETQLLPGDVLIVTYHPELPDADG